MRRRHRAPRSTSADRVGLSRSLDDRASQSALAARDAEAGMTPSDDFDHLQLADDHRFGATCCTDVAR
jgi:hypothetical protein